MLVFGVAIEPGESYSLWIDPLANLALIAFGESGVCVLDNRPHLEDIIYFLGDLGRRVAIAGVFPF